MSKQHNWTPKIMCTIATCPLQHTRRMTCFSVNQVNLRPKNLHCHATHTCAGKERSVTFTQHICVVWSVRCSNELSRKMIEADIVTCCILSSLSSPVFGQMPTWIPDITCLWCSTQRRGCVVGPVAPGTSRQTILLCSHFFDEAHSTNMLPRKKTYQNLLWKNTIVTCVFSMFTVFPFTRDISAAGNCANW